MNDNPEKIYIDKFEYELLKKQEKENQQFKMADFGIKIYRGAVLHPSHPNYNDNRIKIEIFSVDFIRTNSYSIQIDGKEYNINSQNLFNKIKKFISDNLDVLISWSKKQTNNHLDNNAYEGGIGRTIIIKYGQLIININGQVNDIGNLCDEFIDEIKELIVNEGERTDEDYIKESMEKMITQSQKTSDEGVENLKTTIEEVIGNSDPYLNTIVYDIMKKIIDLPNETTTTIADLINYNPNETFVEPLTQGKIRILVKETCKKLNIELEENRDSFGGLAYYFKFKKINSVSDLSDQENEFEKYCKLYEDKFGKKAYIAEPSGTKEQTINAIKTCLEKNEDLLDKILYPNFNKDMEDGILY